MTLEIFDQILSDFPFRPRGVKVSPNLWMELFKSGRISKTDKFLVDLGFDLPLLDQDIFVYVDMELDGYNWIFPSSR